EPSSRPWGGQNKAIDEYEDKLLDLTVDAPKSVGDYIYIESEPVELPDFMDFQARNAHNSTVNYTTPNHEMMWAVAVANGAMNKSEERRVGKECRERSGTKHPGKKMASREG